MSNTDDKTLPALAAKREDPPSITPENYAFLQRYIHRESGIVVEAGKSYLLESRLLPVVREQNLASLNELCNALRISEEQSLKNRVIESITTNETLFFRDMALFEALQKTTLPELIAARRSTKRITIWSAAASSGQEAYSMAMILRDMNLEGWTLQIFATDLNQQILDRAVTGRYPQFEVDRGLPVRLLLRHFSRAGMDWQINDNIRSLVTFRRFDLRSPMHAVGQFDIVLCRNVLIYFDVPTKKKVLAELRRTIAGGGYLVLGAAETTINLDPAYVRVMHGAAALYQVR